MHTIKDQLNNLNLNQLYSLIRVYKIFIGESQTNQLKQLSEEVIYLL
jgi:hypothetical protein